MSISVGEKAPDFALSNQHGEQFQLSAYQGKPVVLVFYPFSFSGVCTGELCELRDNIKMFQDAKVELVGISVDSKYTQAAFAKAENYDFQLLADFWPHGEVCKQYGVFLDDKGFATRATFLIDADGVVVAKFVTAPGQPRNLGEYRSALELL
ncbi:MAG: peroxiredoxin [Aquiluna sp.]|jgi:peroxiredoxin